MLYPIACVFTCETVTAAERVPFMNCANDIRRVLIITYAFPPVGGAGVQRVAKFVKYLGVHGWQASVLTVANPSVPVMDPSLLRDVPNETVIRRARTLEPGYALKAVVSEGRANGDRDAWSLKLAARTAHRLARMILQPDPQILWMPAAVREGKRLLKELPHAAIVASGPPFSTFQIGASLSRASGLPLVLDYRDEWDLSNEVWENRQFGPVAARYQRWLQSHLIRQARALIATTRHSAAALTQLCMQARSKAAVECIYNGVDPDDFPADCDGEQRRPGSPYRLVYTGTLWNLTSVAPLVAAVRILSHRNPDAAAKLELVFAGRRTAEQQSLLDELGPLPCRLVEHPYLEHKEMNRLLRSADGLCMLLSDVRGAERVVPAKLFEYMAVRRPIWMIGPQGEAWDLLRSYPMTICHESNDTMGIAIQLEQEIVKSEEHMANTVDAPSVAIYERRRQARQLAKLLNQITENSQSRVTSK